MKKFKLFKKSFTVATLLVAVLLLGSCTVGKSGGDINSVDSTVNVVGVNSKPATSTTSSTEPVTSKATVPVTEEPTTTVPQTTAPQIDMSDFELTDNSASKLNLVCCDDYIESVYPNNAYHPKIVDTGADGWNGYRYWVSYTPYPSGDDKYENPHIVATNDLINYSEIKYSVSELENYKRSSIFNSDSHIVFNDDLNRLELFWRYTNYDQNYASIKLVYSYDGNNWSEPQSFFETYNRKKEDMVSPAIIYENGVYKVWYVNGYKVRYREYDGSWSDERITDLSYIDGAVSWHIDVIKNSKTGLYEILTCATTDKADRLHMNLYYASSADGFDWGTAVTVKTPSSDPYAWDGGGLYRSTFMYSDGLYYMLYSGRNDSGDIGIGLLFGSDMYNLHGTNSDYIYDGANSARQLKQYIRENYNVSL